MAASDGFVVGNDNYTHKVDGIGAGLPRSETVQVPLTTLLFCLKVVRTLGCSDLCLDSFSFVDVVDKPGTQPVSGFFSSGGDLEFTGYH